MKKYSIISIMICLSLFLPAIGWALNVSPGNISGDPGTEIVVPINISDLGAGIDVDAFSLTINFDSQVLDFLSADKTGTLTEPFSLVAGQVISPGKVKVNGSLFGTPVSITGDGLFVNLKFKVKNTYKSTSLSLTDFKNDIGTATTTNSTFTITGVTTSVVLTPASTLDVVAGQPVTLTAEVLINGNHLDLTNATDVSFSTKGKGAFGAAVLDSGKVQIPYTTHTTVESATITATEKVTGGDHSATSTVSSTPGDLSGLTITPDTVDLKAGETKQFAVTGADANGNAIDPLPTVKWGVTGGIGIISASGLFEAKTVGSGTVTATIGLVSDASGTITVTPGALHTLTVSPETANLTADETQQFTVTGADANGNAIAPLPTVTWEVAGDIGTIDNNGLFTATTVGSGSVKATAEGISDDSGTITVSHGALAKIVLTSDKDKIASGGKGTAVLTATFQDADGNQVESDSGTTVTFTASGAGAAHLTPTTATGDTANGVATATMDTTGTVADPGSVVANIVATDGTMTSDAVNLTIVNFSIEVENNQTNLVRKPLQPNSVKLTGQGATGSYKWTITGVGSFSDTAIIQETMGNPVVFYSPETITGNLAKATIGLEDTGDNSLSATAELSIYNPTKLSFTNTELKQAAGTPGTMTVQIQYDDGTPVNAGAFKVVLTTDSATGKFFEPGTTNEIHSIDIADGFNSTTFDYSDTKVGTPTITAQADGLADATQKETIEPAVANKMTLEADKTTLASDGKGTATLTATILDQYDNVVTTDDTTVVNFALTDATYLTLSSATGNVTDGVATVTVTTKAGTVPDPPKTAGVNITSGTLTPPAEDPDLTLTLVNFSIDVAGNQTSLMVQGTSPDKVVLTGMGGTTGNYRWALEGVGSLSATDTDTVTYSAPASITGASQTAKVTLTDATDSNLKDTVTITVLNTVAIADKPTTPPVVEAGAASAEIKVDGGDGNYTWTATGPGGVDATTALSAITGNAVTFTAPSVGAFAGVYKVEVKDSNGFSDTYEIKVPIGLTPAAKAFTETKLDKSANPQALNVSGAGGDYTWEILESKDLDANPVATPADYGKWAKDSPVVGDSANTFTPADVDEAKRFYLRITVENDVNLTADNGLNRRVFGPFTIIPVEAYTVSVTDTADVAITGATVTVTDPSTGNPIAATVPDPTANKYEFNLPAGGTYTYRVENTGMLPNKMTSNQTQVTVKLEAAGTDKIDGTVTATAGADLTKATVMVFQPDDITRTYEVNCAADGTYSLSLPVGAPQNSWTVVASLPGHDSGVKPDQAIGTVDFTLVASSPTSPDVVANGTASASLTPDPSKPSQTSEVVVPAGGVTEDAYIVITQLPKTSANVLAGSPDYVWEVTVKNATGNPVKLNRVEITLPIDLRVILPGDFENGVYLIYHAPDQATLEAGGGIPVPYEEPGKNILSTDYVGDGEIGSVTFWVDSLSVFGIAAAPTPPTPTPGGGTTLSDSSSSSCFIATAAYGSPFEAHVSLLRKFRDAYLLPHHLGQAFVKTYYQYSPPVADFIAEHDSLRAVVRVGLLPLVGMSYLLVNFGMIGLLAALAGLTLMGFGLVRIRRRC